MKRWSPSWIYWHRNGVRRLLIALGLVQASYAVRRWWPEARLRARNAYWWVSLKVRPVQTVAWGGRPGLDYQLGSREDRARQQHLKTLVAMTRALMPVRRVFVRLAADATEAMRPLARLNRQLEAMR